ncbi:UDPGP type 1 family protein [bacterium]|nr:UDPGP type 1 family protein [bacterium]
MPSDDFGQIRLQLEQYHQEHVLRWWDRMDSRQQERLMRQLMEIDFPQMQKLSGLIRQNHGKTPLSMQPAEVIPLPETPDEIRAASQARELGERMIREGRVCAFVVAGGQGTRLGFDGPKGCFPVGPVSGKSLFQMHAEKIRAASARYRTVIPWYIMTSEANDAETRAFFEQHEYFGFQSRDVYFFKQGMLPALDESGRFIMDSRDHIFTSPDGHGGSLTALVRSGAIEDMKKRNIDVISYFQIDNVLIQIVDPLFIGFHCQAAAEMSSKMVRKSNPYEKVGHFGRVNGKLRVFEYSDMSAEDMEARNEDGRLKYEAGSIGIHLIHPDFVEKETRSGTALPFHVAHKKIPCLNEDGEIRIPDRPNGYKFETFIFDALQDTTRSVILEVRRDHEFSPVKNKDGEDSPRTAGRDLSNYFGEWLEAAGMTLPRDTEGNVQGQAEISPLYADTMEAFQKKARINKEFSGSFYQDKE